MQSPWITIAIPSYNRAPLLLRTVRALQEQTVPDWECVIIDDQSTDSAWDVAQMVAAEDGRFRAFRHTTNQGLAANFRECGSQGTAPYVLMLAADDQLTPQFLEKVREALTTFPDAGLVCGRRVLSDARQRLRPYATPLTGYWKAGTTIARAVANGNLYGLYSSVVIRRQALTEVGGIRADNPWAGDYEAFVKIAARHPVVFVPGAEVYQHVDQSTQTTAFLRSGRLVHYESETLERLLDDPVIAERLSSENRVAAWQRIHALQWSVTLFHILREPWRRGDFGISAQARKTLEEHHCSSVAVFQTMVRLVYQRWRLTY